MVGLPMVAAPIIYAGLAIAYLVVFRDFLRRHGIWILPLAGAFLAASAGIDVALEEDSPFIAEDGSKLFGIVTWTTFFVAGTVGELRFVRPEFPRLDGREPSLRHPGRRLRHGRRDRRLRAHLGQGARAAGA